jgi:streptogramin lyase
VFRTAAAVAALVMLTLAGCGNSDTDGGVEGDAPAGNERSDEGGDSGQTLWATVLSGGHLTGLDTGSGRTVVAPFQIGDFGSDVKHLVAAEGKVWLGLDDGALLVVDAKTGEVATTLTFDAKRYGIEEMAIGGGSAYAAYGGQSKPTLVRLDAATYQTRRQAPVIDAIDSYDGILVDGGTLWVLQANGFALVKADAATLAGQGRVALGQDPKNPTGPFKDLYGYGAMVQVGGNVWIIDLYNHVLIRVDKATMRATRMADLNDTITRNTSVRMAANTDSFFISYSDDDAAKVVRYDGAGGEAKQTYDLGPGAARSLVVTADRMYVPSDEFGRDVLQIDLQSGRTLRTYPNVGAQQLALAA